MAKNAKINKRYTNLYVKRRLHKLEIDIFGIIGNGLLHHTPKNKMLTQMRKEISVLSVQVGLSDAEVNQIWANSYAQYLKISRKTFSSLRKIELKFGKKEDYEESLKQRRAVIYDSIRAKIMKNDLIKEANTIMYSYEHRAKHDEIYGPDGILKRSRTVTSCAYSPFFLASSHPKPAKDHAEWEGKLYYDEDWTRFVAEDDPEYARIAALIRNRKLRTVQWVCGAPVYLITRRNCKHYLRNLPLDEVLHSSAKSLLKKHKMYMAEEKPASEALLMYREYYARLKTEEALYKLIPNEQLAKDITKDKKLVDKWLKKI